MPYEKNPDELGALWEKTGKGGTYFTGKIAGQAVVIFKVRDKRPDSNGPDWRVYKPKPRQEASTGDIWQPPPAPRDDDRPLRTSTRPPRVGLDVAPEDAPPLVDDDEVPF